MSGWHVLLQEARTSLIRFVGSASTNLGSSYLDPAGRQQCPSERPLDLQTGSLISMEDAEGRQPLCEEAVSI